MDELERSIGDLVIANRILAKEDVVDAYGHVSIRHPQQARPLSAVALAQPGIRHPRRHHRVQARRRARSTTARPPYLERFIHGAIYEARPEINAVIHSHAEDMLPFSISKTPMCCVAHVASDMGSARAGVGYRRQVRRRDQSAGDQHGAGPRHGAHARQEQRGADARPRLFGGRRRAAEAGTDVRLSAAQRPHPARRDAAWASSRRCRRARSRPATTSAPGSPEMQRGWEFWARRAGCGDMLASSKGGV